MLGLNVVPHIGLGFVAVVVADATIPHFCHWVLYNKLFQVVRILNVFLCAIV